MILFTIDWKGMKVIMKSIILPDYKNSIVNVACSIRKYFELDYNHNTIKIIDKILEKKTT